MKTYYYNSRRLSGSTVTLMLIVASSLALLIASNSLVAQTISNAPVAYYSPIIKEAPAPVNPNGFVPGDEPLISTAEPTTISFSHDGTYFVVRDANTKGPNFKVHQGNNVHMQPIGQVRQINKNNKLPKELDTELYTARYGEIQDVLPTQAFSQLSAAYKYELYLMVTSGEPYAYFEQYFNNWNYRTCIMTNTWKMNLYLNKKGNLVRVTKKAR